MTFPIHCTVADDEIEILGMQDPYCRWRLLDRPRPPSGCGQSRLNSPFAGQILDGYWFLIDFAGKQGHPEAVEEIWPL